MKRFVNMLLAALLLAAVIGFTGCGQVYSVYGRVADELDQGIANVTITFYGGYSGTTTTYADGNWSKDGLQGAVIVTPSKEGWVFDPTNRQVFNASSGVDFVGNVITKSWSFDFSNMTQEEMDNWFYGYDEPGYPGYYYSDDEGLVLHNIIFRCPINFTGDIVSRTYFYLNVTEAPVFLILTGLNNLDDRNHVYLSSYSPGNGPVMLWKVWIVREQGYSSGKYTQREGDLPGLIWDGLNVIEIGRFGANITMKVNGEEVFRFEARYYDWDEPASVFFIGWLYLGFDEEESGPHGNLVFTRLEVDYSGEMTEI